MYPRFDLPMLRTGRPPRSPPPRWRCWWSTWRCRSRFRAPPPSARAVCRWRTPSRSRSPRSNSRSRHGCRCASRRTCGCSSSCCSRSTCSCSSGSSGDACPRCYGRRGDGCLRGVLGVAGDCDVPRHRRRPRGDAVVAVAVWALLVCLTSANFPDVMMPAYADSRWSVLFFALYLILAHWFLLNLVLGVVYKAHADNARANADAAAAHQERSLRAAFRLLDADGTGALPAGTVEAVFRELNHYKEIAWIGEARRSCSSPRSINRATTSSTRTSSRSSVASCASGCCTCRGRRGSRAAARASRRRVASRRSRPPSRRAGWTPSSTCCSCSTRWCSYCRSTT